MVRPDITERYSTILDMPNLRTGIVGGACLLGLCVTALGQIYSTGYQNLNQVIPDNNPSGLVNSQQLSLPNATIGSLSVTLTLSGVDSGGFNGDMYVLLSHDGASSVLLNRPGKTSGNPFGFGDNGMSVTFVDDMGYSDIHNVQADGGLLTGTFQPDGRREDPATVTDASPRGASLSSFKGLPVDGRWNLMLFDLIGGGQLRLDSWGLKITLVPEPEVTGVAVATALGLLVIVQRGKVRRGREKQ
jgi:hypothetical protein